MKHFFFVVLSFSIHLMMPSTGVAQHHEQLDETLSQLRDRIAELDEGIVEFEASVERTRTAIEGYALQDVPCILFLDGVGAVVCTIPFGEMGSIYLYYAYDGSNTAAVYNDQVYPLTSDEPGRYHGAFPISSPHQKIYFTMDEAEISIYSSVVVPVASDDLQAAIEERDISDIVTIVASTRCVLLANGVITCREIPT